MYSIWYYGVLGISEQHFNTGFDCDSVYCRQVERLYFVVSRWVNGSGRLFMVRWWRYCSRRRVWERRDRKSASSVKISYCIYSMYVCNMYTDFTNKTLNLSLSWYTVISCWRYYQGNERKVVRSAWGNSEMKTLPAHSLSEEVLDECH